MSLQNEHLTFSEIKRKLDLTNRQVLAYSRDFARIYKQERERRLLLENMHHKLQTIVNSMSDAMVATDEKFRILEVNASFSRLFPNIDPGKTVWLTRIFPKALLKKHTELLQKKHHSAVNFEYSLDSELQQVYWVSASKIQSSGDRQSGFVFLLRDVTEIKKFERLKKHFITLASQEIQVPLNGLLGLLYLLYDNIGSRLTDEERSYFSFLINSGKNLQQMLERMLQIHPLQSGDEMDKCFIQLDGLILESLKLSEQDVNSMDVQIQFEVKEKGAILVDRDLLFKAIHAIITNLIAYTKVDGVIEIEQLQSQDDLLLCYRCLDISKSDWQELKEMLAAANGFQQKIEGTGVSLALAREIVEWNGGQLLMKNGKEQEIHLVFPSWSKVVGVMSQ